MPTETDVLAALATVIDPEAGMNIVDLGLIYGVSLDAGKVEVELTMTSPACPMGEMIVDQARQALAAILPAAAVRDIRLVWEPPWSPARMSDKARAHFGWRGDDGA